MRNVFIYLSIAALIAVGSVRPASAQIIEKIPNVQLDPDRKSSTRTDEVQPLHVTDRLIQSPEGQSALAEYHEKKRLGQLPVAKSGDAGVAMSTTRDFQVRNFKESTRETIEFTLGLEEARFNLWVETAELASSGTGDITEQDLEEMRFALAEQTSSRSFRPDSGIIAVDELVFGPPPNVDGDSKTDILLHDIQDFYDPDNGQFSAVLGFFDPNDLSLPNSADIIHIDTVPGMYTRDGDQKPFVGVQQTLAHEYQHLIFAESNSGQGSSFVNEGLSEWAENITGFTIRSITYLGSESERGRPFFEFRGSIDESEIFGGPNGEDYQRAGLFTNYISERIGVFETGAIAQTSPTTSAGYYTVALQPALSLNDVIVNFHIANLVNDRTVAPDFGYEEDQYGSVGISSMETIDGLAQSQYSDSNTKLEAGTVHYVRFTNVADFLFGGDAVSGSNTDRRRLRFILVADPVDGQIAVTETDPGTEPIEFNGDHDAITVLAVHDDLTTTNPLSVEMEMTWDASTSTSEFQEAILEDGARSVNSEGHTEGFPFWNAPGEQLSIDDRASNRFSIPEDAVLSSVDVALLYRSIFPLQSPSSAARDFILKVWTTGQDGQPETEVVSLEVVDNSAPFSNDQSDYVFQTVDLSSFQQDLEGLSGTLHVSVENAGTDDNYIFVPHASLTASTNPSYLMTEFGSGQTWAYYPDLQDSNGNRIVEDLANTIRAKFLLGATGTDTESEVSVPRTVSLEQNYPNPFNPETTISFSLPQARDVSLHVFDTLGRHVATLQDGIMPAGRHDIRFSAGNLPSGLYLYRLSTGSRQLTRSMTLVK